MKVYIIFENNEEEYDDYLEWIYAVYNEKRKAEETILKLTQTNRYKADRPKNIGEYYELVRRCLGWVYGNVGAYRLEEHEVIE